MLEIVFVPKILGPHEIGALGLSLFCRVVNPRLVLWKDIMRMFFCWWITGPKITGISLHKNCCEPWSGQL